MANILLPKHFVSGIVLDPVSADPSNPVEGQQQFSDGTHRAAGLWTYDGSAWQPSFVPEDVALTGTPTAPTATQGTDTTQVATTAFTNEKSEGDSIGLDQTWQDVSSSRAAGVTYTNNTGKPIMVSVSSNSANLASSFLTYRVDGVQVTASGNRTNNLGVYGACTFIVPDGSTYLVTIFNTAGINDWAELR